MHDLHRDRADLNPEDILIAARDSLAVYTGLCFPSFQHAKHIAQICDHLEAVERGEIRRLMMNLPPRLAPAWCRISWGLNAAYRSRAFRERLRKNQ